MLVRICLLSLFLVPISLYSLAQDSLFFKANVKEMLDLMKKQDQEVVNYFNYTVSSTTRNMTEQADKAPATVWVVTDEQIALRNYQSLLEVLYDIPDLKVDYAVDPRWSHDVSIRGIRGMDRFIILLDGVRISSPTNDLIPIMENYPVHFAKQIEVICGAASAQYGADAFSGIINIVSKNSQETKNTFQLIGGQYQTYTGSALVARQINKHTSLMVAGQYHYDRTVKLWNYYPEDYKGINEIHRTGIFNTVFGKINYPKTLNPEPDQNPVSAYGLYAKLDWKKWKISSFMNNAVTPSTYAGNPNNMVYNYGNFIGHKVGVLNLSYHEQIGNWKLASYLTYSRYWLDPESTFQNVYTGFEKAYLFSVGRMFKAEQLFSWTPNPKIEATGGITYEDFFSVPRGHDLAFPLTSDSYAPPPIVNSVYPKNPQGILADIPQVKFYNLGGFLQSTYRPVQSLAVVAGARYDQNSRWGGTFNPRIGIIWEFLPKTTLKGLYGTAFLAPSPLASYDQFGTFFSLDEGKTYQSAFFRLPNPDLKPQIIRTTEMSLNTYFSKNFRFHLSAYHSSISGLFSYVPDALNKNLYKNSYKNWQVGFIETVTNQGKQSNYGGSVRLDYVSENKAKKWNAYLSYSYVGGQVNDDENKATPTLPIPSITPHIFRAGLEFRSNRWQCSLRGIGLSKQDVFALSLSDPLKRQNLQGYFLLNLSSRYRINDHFTVFGFVKNLLNQHYHDVNLGAAPEGTLQGAAANAELAQGMPQNPIRLSFGIQIH